MGSLICAIGWHSPIRKISFDGCSAVSMCKRCGDDIMQDSQGNWFSVGRSHNRKAKTMPNAVLFCDRCQSYHTLETPCLDSR